MNHHSGILTLVNTHDHDNFVHRNVLKWSKLQEMIRLFEVTHLPALWVFLAYHLLHVPVCFEYSSKFYHSIVISLLQSVCVKFVPY